MKLVFALLVVVGCGGSGDDDDDVPCAAGAPDAFQTAGDCRVNVCDGEGGTTSEPDNSDVPAQQGDCVVMSCFLGSSDIGPAPAHTPCMNGAGVCTGNGSCVGCLDGSDCESGVCGGLTCLPSGCVTTHLLISEIRTSGTAGINDDFIELYNPTDASVALNGFTIEARSDVSAAYTVRFTGGVQSIPANHYFLIVGSTYSGTVTSDATLTSGLTDNVSVVLKQSGTVVDAACVYSGTDLFTGAAVPYTCEGTPFLRASAANTDSSLQRKPGGATGNCLDHDDNNADWLTTTPAEPQNLASAPILPQ